MSPQLASVSTILFNHWQLVNIWPLPGEGENSKWDITRWSNSQRLWWCLGSITTWPQSSYSTCLLPKEEDMEELVMSNSLREVLQNSTGHNIVCSFPYGMELETRFWSRSLKFVLCVKGLGNFQNPCLSNFSWHCDKTAGKEKERVCFGGRVVVVVVVGDQSLRGL